ncbi:hypothetical protein ACFLQV_03175 [Calditrichota bacterium]
MPLSKHFLTVLLLVFLTCDNVFGMVDSLRTWIGHPLYQPDYTTTPLDVGEHKCLSRQDRIPLNLENSSDLLWRDLWFYTPNFVTEGREAYLSPAMAGYDRTLILWRNRPFRDPGTLHSDFSLIPVNWIGSVRSTVWGSLNGTSTAGGIVEFQPVSNVSANTVTSLHHRLGFYDVAPVEFIHQRRISNSSGLSLGGSFPASGGRFPHATYNGFNVYSEYNRQISDASTLNVSYATGKYKKEVAYADTTRYTDRNDFDAVFEQHHSKVSITRYGLYRSDQTIDFLDSHSFGEESGFYIQHFLQSKGLYMRISQLNGSLPGGTLYREAEVTGLLSLNKNMGNLSSQFGIGVNGWIDQIKPVALSRLQYQFSKQYIPFVDLKHVNQLPSPEQQYALYLRERNWNELEPIWLKNSDLPLLGRDQEPNTVDGGNVGLKWQLAGHSAVVSLFISHESNPAIWQVTSLLPESNIAIMKSTDLMNLDPGWLSDTVLTYSPIDRRLIRGWQGEYRYDYAPYRALVGAIWSKTDLILDSVTPASFREPQWRALFETGWHREYFNGDFEVDISLSGRYFSSYYAYSTNQSDSTDMTYDFREMEHAYPLDVRFTGRIKSFTLYYGVHNWNSFQYYLVPGYKMIHKEEYFGIDWLLIN